MISRREVVTAGVLGSLTGSAVTAEASQGGGQDDAQMRPCMTRFERVATKSTPRSKRACAAQASMRERSAESGSA